MNTPISLDAPVIATTAPSATTTGVAARAAAQAGQAANLEVQSSKGSTPPATTTPVLDPQKSKELPGQLQRTLDAITGLTQTHGLDLTAILALVIISETKIYKAERQERASQLTKQLSYLKQKAESLKTQGIDMLVGGIVKGAMEIGGGIIRGVGAAKSGAALKGQGEKLSPQEMAASAQAIQMRFGAAGDAMGAVGDIGNATTNYLAKQEESDQTKFDAKAQFAASQASFSGESTGRYWGMLQNVISILQQSIQGNHQAVEASFY